MKLAFDVHGVLDTLAPMRKLLRSSYRYGNEIWIISGQPLDEDMKKFLDEYDLDIYYNHYLSIETYLLNHHVPYTEDAKGKHFADEAWNPVKANMCHMVGIDMIFDNSPQYAPAFDKIDTIFNLVQDKPKEK